MMRKLDKNLSFEIQMKMTAEEVRAEIEYLDNLSFDPSPIMKLVREMINEWDPIGLLANDCPEDEYDSEIRTITVHIAKNINALDEMDLERAIREVFEKAFSVPIKQSPKSMGVAAKIYSSLKILTLANDKKTGESGIF